MDKIFVVKRVTEKLFKTETAIDSAMVEATELMADLLKARVDVSASAVFADDVQVKLMEAMKALSEARTSMVGVHNQLAEAQLRIGVRTKMVGKYAELSAPAERTVMREVG